VGFYEVMRVFQRERLWPPARHRRAERALDDTMAYVRERQAFGGAAVRQAGGGPQARRLRHAARGGPRADVSTCLKYEAGEDALREISMVKLFTAEMVNRVAYDCVQLHGGYGYMREYPIERFRARRAAPAIRRRHQRDHAEIIASTAALSIDGAPEFVAVGHVTLDHFGDDVRPGGPRSSPPSPRTVSV